MPNAERLRAVSAQTSSRDAKTVTRNTCNLLTTKEVSTITGFSTSYFEKGRVYGYGPNFLKIRGKILYRASAVDEWLAAHECTPNGGADVL